MRIYSFFQTMYQSFFSQSLYIQVGRQWRGLGFRYLFALLALCWAVVTLSWMFTLLSMNFSPADITTQSGKEDASIQQIIAHLVQQVPPITVQDGQASLNEVQPYTIYWPGGAEAFAILDTTGEVTSLEGTRAYILLTKEQFYIKKDAMNSEVYPLDGLGNVTIDHAMLYDWVNILKGTLFWGVLLMFFPIALCISFFWCILLLTIYSLITMVITKLMNVKGLAFQDCFRLAVVASTPVVIISAVTRFIPFFGAVVLQDGAVNILPLPFYGVGGILAMIAFLLFAVASNKGKGEGRYVP